MAHSAQLLLIRHAHVDTVGVRLTGRLSGVALSPRGRAEARALPARLRRFTDRLDALYVSPLERAVETAAPLTTAFGVVPRRCAGVIEMDTGTWTGRRFDDLERDPAWRLFNEHRSEARVPGGEAPRQLQARVLSALTSIAEAHRGATVAVVTHAEIIRSTVLHYAGLSLDNYWCVEIPPASITLVRFDESPELLVVADRTWPGRSAATSFSSGAQAPGAG